MRGRITPCSSNGLKLFDQPVGRVPFGVEPPMGKRLKLLGFGIDPLLNASYREGLLRQRTPKRIMALKLLAQTRWGCEAATLLRYYAAFARPVIEYANPLLLAGINLAMGRRRFIRIHAFVSRLGPSGERELRISDSFATPRQLGVDVYAYQPGYLEIVLESRSRTRGRMMRNQRRRGHLGEID